MTQELFDRLLAARSPQAESRPYVAVAGAEGTLADLHLGEADQLLIFDAQRPTSFDLARTPRRTRPAARARRRARLNDCRAVRASGAGETEAGC